MFDFEFYNVFIFYLVRKEDYDTFKNSVEENFDGLLKIINHKSTASTHAFLVQKQKCCQIKTLLPD